MSQIMGAGGGGRALIPANFADSPNPGVSLNPTAGVAITAKRSDEILALDVTAAYAFSGLGATTIADATQSTSTITGSIKTAGGLGVAKAAFFGGNITTALRVLATDINIVGASSSLFWTGSGNTFLTAGIGAATLQLGAGNTASPVAQTFQSQGSRSGTDTNVAGSNLTIASGQGTGNSTGSSLIFQTPAAVASGTGAQTMTTALTIDGAQTSTFAGPLVANNSTSLNTTTINSGGGYSLTVINAKAGGTPVKQYASSTTGFAGIDLYDANGTSFKATFGWGNSASGAPFANNAYIDTLNIDFLIIQGASGTTETFRFLNSGGIKIQQNTIITAPSAAIFQHGAANAASPVAQTLQAQGSRAGTDTNVAGAKFSINPGAGTGNATPNPLQLNSYVAVASGTGVQTLTNTITLNSGLVQFNTYTTAGIIINDASGNLTSTTSPTLTLAKHSQAEVDTSYGYFTPASGGTVTMAANSGRAVINPAAGLATLTIVMPPSPIEGQVARGATSQAVTLVTMGTSDGSTIVAGLSSLAADGTFAFLYRSSTNSWYPSN